MINGDNVFPLLETHPFLVTPVSSLLANTPPLRGQFFDVKASHFIVTSC